MLPRPSREFVQCTQKCLGKCTRKSRPLVCRVVLDLVVCPLAHATGRLGHLNEERKCRPVC